MASDLPNSSSPPEVSRDVKEGRTLFLRNISLDTEERQINDIFAKFGSMKKVVFCKDHNTQSFKGTGFAEFETKEGAESCLESFEDPAYRSEFVINGRSMTIMKAVSRKFINSKQKGNMKEKKDSRNIFLAREGVIRDGTMAAKDVSKGDLKKRVEREMMKRKLLANFNTFVSPVRLFIQNLPLSLTDGQLKEIFRTHSPKGALITEARVMRNLQDIDDNGTPISKGFGFISFSKHEDSLHSLRTINNNPSIFQINKRPIVEFSIENAGALKARNSRLLKSQENNKTSENNPKKSKKGPHTTAQEIKNALESSETVQSFGGSKADPNRRGMKAFSTHVGPKRRHDDGKHKKISRNAINNTRRRAFMTKKSKLKKKQNLSKKSKSK